MKSSPDGVLVVDPTARIISINRRFGEIFDVPAALLASRDDAALLAMVSKKVRDADRFLRRVRDLCAQPDQSARDEMVLKDGRVIDRLTSPFKSAGGEYLGRIWFFRDISEGRKAEELLRSSKARFGTLVEEAPDAILLYDVDQDRLITVNKAAERLFGAPRDEILEHGPRRFFAPQQPDGRPVEESYFEYNGRALAGEEVTFDLRIRRLFGEERMCRANLVRLPSNVHLLRVSLVDVTEQRAAETWPRFCPTPSSARKPSICRIARELHDALGQYLAAMSMKMEICGRSVPEVSPLKTWLDRFEKSDGDGRG